MFVYFSLMILLTAAGILSVVAANSTLGFGVGLALITLGSGGISAGLMTREVDEHDRNRTRGDGSSR